MKRDKYTRIWYNSSSFFVLLIDAFQRRLSVGKSAYSLLPVLPRRLVSEVLLLQRGEVAFLEKTASRNTTYSFFNSYRNCATPALYVL